MPTTSESRGEGGWGGGGAGNGRRVLMPTWNARSVGQRAGEAGLGHTHLQCDSGAWTVVEETKNKRTLEGKEASGFSATHSLTPPAHSVTTQQAAPAGMRSTAWTRVETEIQYYLTTGGWGGT